MGTWLLVLWTVESGVRARYRVKCLMRESGVYRGIGFRDARRVFLAKVSFLRRKTNNTQAPGLDTPRCVTLGFLSVGGDLVSLRLAYVQ